MHRVIFVCVGNTCRSVLAEYLGRRFCGTTFTFESAGIHPQPSTDADNAVHTLRHTFDIDAARHQPRDVRDVDLAAFDLVVAFQRDVARVVRELGVPDHKLRVWPIHDPWGGNLEEYGQAALEIRQQLADLKRAANQEP